MLTDSHCHLFYEEILKDIDNVFKRSKELGVNRFICVGTNINDSLLFSVNAVCSKYHGMPRICPTLVLAPRKCSVMGGRL